MAQSNWEADKMLDVYIYDYLLKRNLQTTAKAFMAEGKVAADPVAIDAPGGFLFEWWSVFWDIFIARTNEKHSEVAAAYLEAQQIKAREHQQQMQMQQLQLMQQRHAQLQRTNPSHPSLNGPINALNSDGILGPSTASVLAAKMYEERLKHPHSMDSEGSQLLDASRMALLKSAATNHAGQLVPGTPGNVSTTLQQIQARNQQTIDIKSEGNMGVPQRSLSMDPSSLYGQGIIQPKPGLGGAGLSQGVSGLPLKGWPLTGIDQLRPNLGAQMQKPFLSTQSQFQLMTPQQQQQFLAQAQAQGNLTNSSNYGDMDPRRLTALARGGLNGKEGQPAGTDGCISSPMQSSSPKVRPDQEYLMKDDLEHFGDVGSLDDNVESFLSNDDGDARDIFAALKRSPAEPNPATSKGFTFSEVNCWRTSNSKVVCCHFSSDGKILASAGHEKKAVLWNMENFQTQYLPEEHALIITDPGFSLHTFTGHGFQVTSLDFHPKKTDLLCSCDGNGEIRYWNVTQPTCLRAMKGGTAQVRFQPNAGQFLAAAAENVVSVFDIETHGKKYTLQGHNTDVQSVCWDNSGEYLASVSQDLVKVWSVSSGECIHELSSNGNKFHSCVFHPGYTNLLVIGGYQSLELWNMVKNQSMTVQAHEGLIAALAQSPVTGMVASASHDNSVKLWK
ncbi:hypothetical protein PR202_ga03263 [Eleusine coracana subsp. coracana]|uniref:Uncharacterized protein n=1 Tax=Eleusine coracana subsp. coracana TaxID=191504 RepID=A0AAV5BN27_ELECO|nr:hypothetical protein PR202_ga03263 [Eleusine coracana subsp. coracana]